MQAVSVTTRLDDTGKGLVILKRAGVAVLEMDLETAALAARALVVGVQRALADEVLLATIKQLMPAIEATGRELAQDLAQGGAGGGS